jgi:hypothetical protein
MLTQVTLFYTHNLRGNLAYLPRLYTYLERARMGLGASLLLDLGNACAPEVWHCKATGGRSVLVVLDGMGYHALNVADALTVENRHKLEGITTAGLVDLAHVWRYHVPPVRDEGIVVSLHPSPALRLCIVLTPAERTHLTGGCLYLAGIGGHQVGMVRVNVDEARLDEVRVDDVPPDLPPNVTIAAAVEFVEAEARL